jgi:ADP-heptose:LPS heptosyltransferase
MAQNEINIKGNARGVKNVLITRFSAIGDVAMTVPVIYSACRCYPDVRFVLLTRPTMTGIFVNAPDNLVLVGADVKEKYAGMKGLRQLANEVCRDYDIDIMVDLHAVLRTYVIGLCCRLRGVKVYRLNKGRARRRALTRKSNKVMLPLVSQRARYREVFFKAGLPLTERFNGLFEGHATAPAAMFSAITAPRPRGERWVGIAPFAAHGGKIYPTQQMEQVVEMLSRHDDIRLFLFGGGKQECEVLDKWAATYPHVTSLAGKRYGFTAELSLFNHLDAVLTMDSGNMHLASIAGTHTVSVWGATHPYCGFKGWRQSDNDTVQLPLTCRPCSVFGNKPCYRGDYLCLTGIRPEVIYNKVMEKLAMTQNHSSDE